MTFLLDHDTPDDLAYSLTAVGHQVVHLRNVLAPDAEDLSVLTYAHQQGWVVITCNRDDFLFLAKVHTHAGIIILIRRKSRVAERAALIRLLDRAGEGGIMGNINFA